MKKIYLLSFFTFFAFSVDAQDIVAKYSTIGLAGTPSTATEAIQPMAGSTPTGVTATSILRNTTSVNGLDLPYSNTAALADYFVFDRVVSYCATCGGSSKFGYFSLSTDANTTLTIDSVKIFYGTNYSNRILLTANIVPFAENTLAFYGPLPPAIANIAMGNGTLINFSNILANINNPTAQSVTLKKTISMAANKTLTFRIYVGDVGVGGANISGHKFAIGGATTTANAKTNEDPASVIVYGKGVNSAPLSVNLISFNAQKTLNGTKLSWQTTNEIDNAGFEIQKSEFGRSFSKIGFVNNQNNENNDYSFIDQSKVGGYYRLKQIDINGKETLSKIIYSAEAEGNDLIIWPNPVNENLQTNLKIGEDYEIYNLNGKLLLQGIASENGFLPLNSIPKGNYLLRNRSNTTKFIKQ